MPNWKEYLSSLYFNPQSPGSFLGPEKLYQLVKSEGKYKIGRYRIRKWLQNQESYSLTREARRHFVRSRVIVNGIDSQWDIDLMDMVDLAKDNDEYKYLLVTINVFSRYAYARPLKSKKGTEVTDVLRNILSGRRKPNTIRSDMGMEFRSKEVNKLLQSLDIHHFYCYNSDIKANFVERLIKTLKHKIFRYLLKKRTKRYIDVLPQLVKSYNATVHRSLGVAPDTITTENEGESRLQQYLIRTRQTSRKVSSRHTSKRPNRYKFKIGQTVRISHIRGVFDREYSQKWTGEIFKVDSRFKREGIPVYKLKDWDGQEIKGSFTNQELQGVTVDDTTEYHIEKVLKRRTRNKRREVLVRWLHWPKQYDSWIPQNDVINYS